MNDRDSEFFKRADEHINLSNTQLSTSTRGKVSESMLFSVARFSAWVSATGWKNSEDMLEAKERTMEFFTSEFKAMLEENMEDYIRNFDTYMGPIE